jgi:glycosyltransferase involved in cell wall biosynthesis
VGSFVIGLASGLSRLDGEDEYLFLTVPGHEAWLRPFLRGSCRMISVRHPPSNVRWKASVKRHAPFAVSAWRRWRPTTASAVVRVEDSDGVIESEGVNVMHLTAADGFHTTVPTIYHPHDLQHLHLPQYFAPELVAGRDVQYRDLCARATMVAVASTWTKHDLIAQYGLSDKKIQVIPLAPLLSEYPTPSNVDLVNVSKKFGLPDGGFAFYPAQTWEHKNHLMLMEALTRLRRDGLAIPFVSCGKKTDFYAKIEDRVGELGIQDQVRFLGFVSPLELQCLYRLSRCVVLPTKFEAASFPLWEAFLSGTPAACSAVTSLPEQAGGAALLFNPDRPDEIASAVRSLWGDQELRQTLVERAHENVAQLSWERTARMFRAHYRRIAGRELSKEDLHLLSSDVFWRDSQSAGTAVQY